MARVGELILAKVLTAECALHVLGDEDLQPLPGEVGRKGQKPDSEPCSGWPLPFSHYNLEVWAAPKSVVSLLSLS